MPYDFLFLFAFQQFEYVARSYFVCVRIFIYILPPSGIQITHLLALRCSVPSLCLVLLHSFFPFYFSLGVSRSLFKVTHSFLSSVECTDEPAKGILYPLFLESLEFSIRLFFAVSTSLLEFLLFVCTLSTFSSRAFHMPLQLLTPESYPGLQPGSVAYFVSCQ